MGVNHRRAHIVEARQFLAGPDVTAICSPLKVYLRILEPIGLAPYVGPRGNGPGRAIPDHVRHRVGPRGAKLRVKGFSLIPVERTGLGFVQD